MRAVCQMKPAACKRICPAVTVSGLQLMGFSTAFVLRAHPFLPLFDERLVYKPNQAIGSQEINSTLGCKIRLERR